MHSTDKKPGRISYCVLHPDGRILHQVRDVLPVYSITKSLIARLVDLLGISVNQRVSNWISTEVCGHPVTVRQLLNHSSGLVDYGHLQTYQTAIQRGEVWDNETFAKQTLSKPLQFTPGLGFAYSNPGYWLLKRIVEIESNRDFQEALAQFIFAPNQMSSAYLARGQFDEDLPNYPAEWVWHGLVIADATDIARFFHSLKDIDYMANAVAVPGDHPSWQNPHYGNGLMIEPDLRFGHNGSGPGYSSSAMHFVQTGITACVIESIDEQAHPDSAQASLLSLVRELGYSSLI